MEQLALLAQVIVHIIGTLSMDVCAVISGVGQQPADVLNTIIHRLQLTHTYTIYRDTVPSNERCNLFVALVHDADEFRVMFDNIETQFIVSSHFVVAILPHTESNGASDEAVAAVLQQFWNLRLVNVVALLADDQTGHGIHAFTYMPYTSEHCSEVHPLVLGRISTPGDLAAYTLNVWFPDKLLDLHGCPLYISTREWDPYMMLKPGVNLSAITLRQHDEFHEVNARWLDGPEARLIQELGRRMRFSARVLFAGVGHSSRGTKLDNGTFTGILSVLASGEADISVGSLGPTTLLSEAFRYTFPYHYEPVVFVLPHGRNYTSFEQLLRPFSTTLWLCCVAFFVVATVLLWALSHSGLPQSASSTITVDFTDMVSVFVGGSYTRAGRKPVRRAEHGWLMLWLLVALVLRTINQGYMFKFIRQNSQVMPPDTVAELNRMGFRYMCDAEGTTLFQLFDVLNRNFLIIPKITSIDDLGRLTYANASRAVMIFGRDSVDRYNENRRSEAAHQKVLQYTSEYLFMNTNSLYIANRTIFLDHINQLLLRLSSMGFLNQIDGRGGQAATDDNVQMSVNNFVGVFELCGFWLLVSIVVFIAECWPRVRK